MRIAVSAAEGIPAAEQLWFRSLWGVTALLPFAIRERKKGVSLIGQKGTKKALFLRSLVGFASTIALFYALGIGKQADITIISKTSPFFIFIFSVVFLRQKMQKVQIPSLFLAFLGAYFVISPQMETGFIPLLIALFSAIMEGGAITYIDYLQRHERPFVVLWYYYAFSFVASFLFALPNFVVPPAAEWRDLFLIGLFAFLGQLTLNGSLRLAEASKVGIYHYFGIVFSMILGYFCLGETIGKGTLLGGVLVILAGVIVYLFKEE
ncbi:MAG: DMT family transporter [Anaerotignum sp.]|nr:DMT family transporter [Anaerotignum sp.]